LGGSAAPCGCALWAWPAGAPGCHGCFYGFGVLTSSAVFLPRDVCVSFWIGVQPEAAARYGIDRDMTSTDKVRYLNRKFDI